jgi:hypothetical protein
MRASLYLIGFAAASLLGAGVAGIGCSSSSSPATTPPEDASTTTDSPTTTPPEDTGTGTDAAAKPCVPLDASAATIVTGSPLWDCYEAKCATSLTACAAECGCNDDVLNALQCIAADAGTSTTCFATVSTNSTSDTVEMTMLNCLLMNNACMNATAGDGGTEGGTTTPEAGPDAGDGG